MAMYQDIKQSSLQNMVTDAEAGDDGDGHGLEFGSAEEEMSLFHPDYKKV